MSERDFTQDQVYRWRVGVFRSLGFDDEHAGLMAADLSIDTHKVAGAVRSGCSIELALSIFL